MARRFSLARLLIPLEVICLVCLLVGLALHRRHRHTTPTWRDEGSGAGLHRWSQSYPGGSNFDGAEQSARGSLRRLGTALGVIEAASLVSDGREGASFEMMHHDWVRAPGVFLVMSSFGSGEDGDESGESLTDGYGLFQYDDESPIVSRVAREGGDLAPATWSLRPGLSSVGSSNTPILATSSPSPSRMSSTGSSFLRGRVVEFSTGAPVAGTSVAFVWNGQRSAGLTDEGGNFELAGVVARLSGRLLVRADATRYAEDTRDLTLPADPLPPSGKASTVITIAPIRLVRLDSRPASARAGVGLAAVNRAGRAVVAYVVPGSPAALAAVRAGDLLIAVDGRDTTDLGTAALGVLLRGEPASDIELTVAPATSGEARTVHLRRAG